MKPALFPSSFAPHLGGVEEMTRQLALAQVAAGKEPSVMTHREPRDLPAHELIEGLPVTRLPFPVTGSSARHWAGWAARSAAATRRTTEAVRGHDLVHVHCVSSNADYALAAARRNRVPLVVTLHGEIGMDASQVYQRDPAMVRRWRRLLTAADAVTAVSQFVLTEAEELYGGSLTGTVISNGVDVAALQRPPVPRSGVFALGRHVPQKGFDLLVASGLPVRLGGSGPETERLRELALPHVTFLGSLDRQQVADELARAAVFVLPSRQEAQGIVVLEAMAAGAAVLAADVGGVPETVQDGVNGLLFTAGSTEALTAQLQRLLASFELRQQLTAQATITAEQHDWAVIEQAYAEVYARVL